MARSWYAFMGDDPTDYLNYYKLTIKHECLCGDQICAIYATGSGFQPDQILSQNMQKYIKDALSTMLIQPGVPFNAKKYVYLKY